MKLSHLHIALFMPSLDGGGAERVSLTLASSFAKAGCSVTLVVASAAGTLSGEVPPGVELVDLKAGRVCRSVRPLARWLKAHNPDALLSSQYHANVAAFVAHRWSSSGAKLLLREDSTPTRNLAAMGRFSRQALRVLLRIAYRGADAVITVSRGAGEDLRRFLRDDLNNLRVIYNPVLSSRIFRLARERAEHPWLLDGSFPVVLSVGRLSEEKDFATLLRAFAGMQQHREARLIILGEGPLRGRLEELVATLGMQNRVSLPGFVPNPYSYMARAQLFVLSSKYEGLPGVLIEALACGCKIVSTDCPSGPREILRDATMGRLVPVGDADRLRQAMEEGLLSGRHDVDLIHLRPFTAEECMNHYLELVGNR